MIAYWWQKPSSLLSDDVDGIGQDEEELENIDEEEDTDGEAVDEDDDLEENQSKSGTASELQDS